MPNVLPTIPNDPPQGIQALLDKVYLWNPDVSNELIAKVNELLTQLDAEFATIHPYSELVAPVTKYQACYYEDGVYVANKQLETVPAEFNAEDWTLIATKFALPDQTDNAGKFLQTDGTGVRWNDALTNESTNERAIAIHGGKATGDFSVAITSYNAVGFGGNATAIGAIQIGTGNATAIGAIQLGSKTGGGVHTNDEPYTVKISLGSENITLLKSDGLIPAERMGAGGTEGQVLTKTAAGMAWQDSTGGSGAVASVNGKTGEVTISAEDVPVTFAGEEETLQMAIDTLKTDQGDLGEQVGTIEGKIPETASETNQLATKEDLGAYLPLAGGTMEGPITRTGSTEQFAQDVELIKFNITTNDGFYSNTKTIGVSALGTINFNGLTISGSGTINPYRPSYVNLGSMYNRWQNVYADNITTNTLNVETNEGSLGISVVAGVATIATNNGLDIISPTKFDTAPTTDDATPWADVNVTALVTKAQVTTALSTAGGGTTVTIRNWA